MEALAAGLDSFEPASAATRVLSRDGALVEDGFLGDRFLVTGFGDRFKVSRGGSRRFEEGVRRTEELAELQGKRASKRSSLAV